MSIPQINAASLFNPENKEVFDSGLELDTSDPLASQTYYAPNRWPEYSLEFRSVVQEYDERATAISLALLSAVAQAINCLSAITRPISIGKRLVILNIELC